MVDLNTSEGRQLYDRWRDAAAKSAADDKAANDGMRTILPTLFKGAAEGFPMMRRKPVMAMFTMGMALTQVWSRCADYIRNDEAPSVGSFDDYVANLQAQQQAQQQQGPAGNSSAWSRFAGIFTRGNGGPAATAT